MEPDSTHRGVRSSLQGSPVIGVVRTHDRAEAEAQAGAIVEAGIELVEITFTVPEATEVVAALLADRDGDGPPWIGMGTVTDAERTTAALAAGADFIVSPNASSEVAKATVEAGRFFVCGALTPTEIVEASKLGADIVKVFPLPPVGGPGYLSVVRGPLGDVPMLAAGGFGVEEIPAYQAAGAAAFGIGAPILLGSDLDPARGRRALELARGAEA